MTDFEAFTKIIELLGDKGTITAKHDTVWFWPNDESYPSEDLIITLGKLYCIWVPELNGWRVFV